ncbi:MAG: hypothetical protein Q9159_006091 [Coniocarpon cinnabarinum]
MALSHISSKTPDEQYHITFKTCIFHPNKKLFKNSELFHVYQRNDAFTGHYRRPEQRRGDGSETGWSKEANNFKRQGSVAMDGDGHHVLNHREDPPLYCAKKTMHPPRLTEGYLPIECGLYE